jgi:hypothetical protein
MSLPLPIGGDVIGMARQSGIYSTPEKYTQPCEICLNIAEYTTTFKKKIYHNVDKHINISKNISTNLN